MRNKTSRPFREHSLYFASCAIRLASWEHVGMNEDPIFQEGRLEVVFLHDGGQLLQASERKVQIKYLREFQVQLSYLSPQVPQTENAQGPDAPLFRTGFCPYKATTVWKCPQLETELSALCWPAHCRTTVY